MPSMGWVGGAGFVPGLVGLSGCWKEVVCYTCVVDGLIVCLLAVGWV